MATTQCLSCAADSELFLCRSCVAELRGVLTNLAQGPEVNGKTSEGLLAALEDVCFKMTRLSSGTGHRKRGDELPDLFEPDAADSTAEKVKRTRQGQASDLLREARNTLTTIVRDVLETRGVEVRRAFKVVDRELVGPLLPGWRRAGNDWRPTLPEIANWLAVHVHSLACDESAGVWKRDVDGLVRRIEKVIDRPPAPRFCGPCIHYVERNRHCGALLYARRDAIEVTCRTCRTTHNIEHLSRYLENRADVMRFTSSEILIIMTTLNNPIPPKTWWNWRNDGRVKVRGYKRPDNPDGTRGSVGLHRRSDADEPVYRLAEVRKVYAAAIKHSDALVGAST